MLTERFNHAAELQVFQTSDYELSSSIYNLRHTNGDAKNLENVETKLKDGSQQRADQRAKLQDAIKEADKQIEIHEDAKAKFSKDFPFMKKELS